MGIVRGALRRPFTVLVAVLALVLSAFLALRGAPIDIFPNLGVPVLYVVQPFAGLSPSQMEGQVVTYYEYHFLYVNGVEHIDSQSIQGMAMLKLYFRPGTDIAQSMAQVVAMSFRATAFMPPGTLPPFIVRFDAGSIPVGQLVFSSDQRSDQEIQDLALYRVRPLLATLPGVSAPPPFGGKVRTIVAYVDPDRMRAYNLSPEGIATELARANLTLPAGNVRTGHFDTIAATNALVQRPKDFESVPLRIGPGPTVFLRDVGRVEDGADIVYNIALVNGRRTVYMPLSGLALAIGILVDEATVTIENMHTHLGRDRRVSPAILDVMAVVMVPKFLAMLCVIAVFIPSFFMIGIGRALFPPLALAVAFSMMASFILSVTLVPVLAAYLFRGGKHGAPHAQGGRFERLQERYSGFAKRLVGRRRLVLAVYCLVCIPAFLLARHIGTELFPRVDTGQFQLRVRAPDGMRLEDTERIVREVDQLIRDDVGGDSVEITLANIGNTPWEYPVNGIFVWNSGPHEAILLVALKGGRRPAVRDIEESIRAKLAQKFPDVRFSFEAGDIVSQVLNFGAPAPISVTVSGNKLSETRRYTERMAAELEKIGSLRDVQIPQALDYPTLDVTIDRERAGQLGVTVDRVGKSIVAATSSSVLVTPNFWTDPASGIPYRVALRVPESGISSGDDLSNLPVMPDGAARPLTGDIATVTSGKTFGEIDHRNSQRTLSVQANLTGADLGRAASAVEDALKAAGPPPRGTTVAVHGQIEQMQTTLASLREGLLLAVIVILLLLTANFQSVRDALIVLSTVPAVLIGVVLALFVTRSTLNVQSMMGAIMSIGVSVANALLLVTFARERRVAGDASEQAALTAARMRLRPILMTSLAMIAGMIPMALGLGEGGEQTAPLGRAVIGGLSASTVATLLTLPALYVIGAARNTTSPSLLEPESERREDEP